MKLSRYPIHMTILVSIPLLLTSCKASSNTLPSVEPQLTTSSTTVPHLELACAAISDSLLELQKTTKYYLEEASTIHELIASVKQAADSIDEASTILTLPDAEVFNNYSLNLNKFRIALINQVRLSKQTSRQLKQSGTDLEKLCPLVKTVK